jgi:Na+/H+ antiporter NhaC
MEDKISMHKSTLQFLLAFSLGLIFGLLMKFSLPLFLALVATMLSVFIYTMRDAEGLKHNQDKYFVVMSALLYFIALAVSLCSSIAIVLLAGYEISKEKNLKTLSLRLLPHIIITVVSIFLFI